ncbi:MAG: hypothetical protein H7316_12360, partial [Tardiphaga sp.]|nr:hypothetical protein [Tardiphaga sp.]
VLRYAGDFIPSWAGAISIDLMPAVLVLILCVVHAAIRREGQPSSNATDMTVGEMMMALKMAREIETARHAVPEGTPPDGDAAAISEAASDENVTPLSSARHTK